jgi:hypothetical protein
MVEKELLELINQMSAVDSIYDEKEGYYTNEGSPAWNATRIAESLKDTTFIPFLSDLLEKSKNETIKRDIYFTLGKIGVNTGDKLDLRKALLSM